MQNHNVRDYKRPLFGIVALANGTTIACTPKAHPAWREPRPKEVPLGCALIKGLLEALDTTYLVTG
jgi:hypothetical protein